MLTWPGIVGRVLLRVLRRAAYWGAVATALAIIAGSFCSLWVRASAFGHVYDEGSVLNNAPYKMDGMTVLLWSRGDEYRLQIESIGTGRMVQYFDSGRRLACQKAY